jgi:hypothetical protein
MAILLATVRTKPAQIPVCQSDGRLLDLARSLNPDQLNEHNENDMEVLSFCGFRIPRFRRDCNRVQFSRDLVKASKQAITKSQLTEFSMRNDVKDVDF